MFCFIAVSFSAKAQNVTKFVFDVGNGKTVESVSPKPVTRAETERVLTTASYRGSDARHFPVHVYYYNPRTGGYDYQYSGDLGYSPGTTLGDIIDFLLSIWHLL